MHNHVVTTHISANRATMKYILALVFMLLTFMATSQVGLRGGLNYSNVMVDGANVDFGAGSKVGYHLGLQGNVNLLGIKLRPALLYHVKGGRTEAAGSEGNANLHYIEVPVNLSLSLGTGKYKVIGEAGPYFGYLFDTSSGFIENLDERLKSTDWGINFGLVLELDGLGIGVNYSNSLSDISRDDQVAGAFKTTNGNLALYGYLNF